MKASWTWRHLGVLRQPVPASTGCVGGFLVEVAYEGVDDGSQCDAISLQCSMRTYIVICTGHQYSAVSILLLLAVRRAEAPTRRSRSGMIGKTPWPSWPSIREAEAWSFGTCRRESHQTSPLRYQCGAERDSRCHCPQIVRLGAFRRVSTCASGICRDMLLVHTQACQSCLEARLRGEQVCRARVSCSTRRRAAPSIALSCVLTSLTSPALETGNIIVPLACETRYVSLGIADWLGLASTSHMT